MIVFNIKTQEVYNPLYNNTDKLITLITGGRGSAKSFNVGTFIESLHSNLDIRCCTADTQ